MHKHRFVGIATTAFILLPLWPAVGQVASISEETRAIKTYPFSEPNSVPILSSDPRLYPYHSFEGYATAGEPRDWKVVRLENEYIEVFVLPEVGGKVWGAVVKENGHEFIYRNEVLKFRNIALRGPWTSGGIEFNFGVIGHTPSTATPVDYVLMENPDGSVSCVVGGMDLPSRTQWRVEIRLPSDRAYFETNVTWYNPTPLPQPYYNWMTAAAFARTDLEMFIPGNAFLEHSGAERAWPSDSAGRDLPVYANNTFDGHKSYHVVGELNDFFGGYYRDDDYGFGHWARYEEMPGQKLWLWALSREGGVWEDLLTDTDGQYVEYQAGRLLVQYAPGPDVNPITQAEFDPGAADRWSETWFPLEGTGGLTDASRDGAMHIERAGRSVTIRINAFGGLSDTLRVTYGGRPVSATPLSFAVLDPVTQVVELPGDGPFRVELEGLGLQYDSDPGVRELDRPFSLPARARKGASGATRLVFEASELKKARYYGEARPLYQRALNLEPWNREALLGMAELEYRRARYADGLRKVRAALMLDSYDAEANFWAGNMYAALGNVVNAIESYGWSARSMEYRSVSYLRLAEMSLGQGSLDEAERYAKLSIDYDRYSLPARDVLSMTARQRGDTQRVAELEAEILALDPLHHFVYAERYLASTDGNSARSLRSVLRSEYPDQILLELVVDYVRRGASEDARKLLAFGEVMGAYPLTGAWRAWIEQNPRHLGDAPDPSFVFPYRQETLPVLEWAAENDDHWSWRYLLALNLWGLDRRVEAASLLEGLGNDPNVPAAYVARANLLDQLGRRDPEQDLRRAAELGRNERTMQIHLIQYLQDQKRWDEALELSHDARARFPDDFDLDLLHVRSLNNLGRGSEAIGILESTHVLPSEHAGESHRLYEQAHTIAALDAYDRGAWSEARQHLLLALEWPEHLGQGRPYEPEERLIHYTLAAVAAREGDLQGMREELLRFVAGERSTLDGSRRDALNVAAFSLLGKLDEFPASAERRESGLHDFTSWLYAAVQAGETVADAVARIADDRPEWFGDLEGTQLLRALSLSR